MVEEATQFHTLGDDDTASACGPNGCNIAKHRQQKENSKKQISNKKILDNIFVENFFNLKLVQYHQLSPEDLLGQQIFVTIEV